MIQETIQIDDRVRLTHDVPDLSLHKGDEGLVCSVWHIPGLLYEVEFATTGSQLGVRALLMQQEVEVEGMQQTLHGPS